jgi:nucleoporin NUP42
MGRDIRPGVEKPLWGLSSYGPAKLEPNLVSGLDMSFEELRLNAVMALQNNTVAEYVRRHLSPYLSLSWANRSTQGPSLDEI